MNEKAEIVKVQTGKQSEEQKLTSDFTYGHPTSQCPSNHAHWLSAISKEEIARPITNEPIK